MNAKELAQQLTGREYGCEITKDEEAQAKAPGEATRLSEIAGCNDTAVAYEINRMMFAYFMATGKAATRIYLGRNQMRNLLSLDYYRIPEGAAMRNEYCGCKVFKVDDDDHLAVA